MRVLLVAGGENAEACAAALASAGYAARLPRADDVATCEAALRDPLDLIVVWDDDTGRRGAAVAETAEEYGAAVPVIVVAHPGARDAARRALDAGALAVHDRGDPALLSRELARAREASWLSLRLALAERRAHDLANLLAPVPLAVHLLEATHDRESAGIHLDSVRAATLHSMSRLRELLELLTADPAVPLRVPPEHLVTLASRAWRRSPRGSVAVATDFPPDLPSVRVDPLRALQVLRCLACRAVEGAAGREGTWLLFAAHEVAEAGTAPRVGLAVVSREASTTRAPVPLESLRAPEPADGLGAILEAVETDGGSLRVVHADGEPVGYALLLLPDRPPGP